MDQVHEDHLARILENRRRRGALGVYSSEASKRLSEAANQTDAEPRRAPSVTAGTQTRETRQLPPPSTGAEEATSPTRPFRYPPSAQGPTRAAAMPSANSLFDTILNHSTADLRSEDGSPQPPSGFLNEESPRWGSYGTRPAPAGVAAQADEPIRQTRPSSLFDGPGWQRTTPQTATATATAAAPSATLPSSRWGSAGPGPTEATATAQRSTSWRAGAASASSGETTERVPAFAYRGGGRQATPAAAAAAAPPAAPRGWSAPRIFTSTSGLLHSPRWQDTERQPSVPPQPADVPRWRSPPSALGADMYPSYAPPRRPAFDPNRSKWFSSALQESYPLPIVREESDPFAPRRGYSANGHRDPSFGPSFSRTPPPPQRQPAVGGGVRWTDDAQLAANGPAGGAAHPRRRAERASRGRRRAAASSSSSSSSSSTASDAYSDSASDSSETDDRRRSRRRGSRRDERRDRTSKSRGASRRRHRDRDRTSYDSDEGRSEQSGLDGTQAPSTDGWKPGAVAPGDSRGGPATVVYTGDGVNGGALAFPVSRNQPPRHPPRMRSYYDEAPIGLPDVRSTIDIRTSVQVLMSGDWFYKWDRKGNTVHQRWVWVDVKSYLLVWSRKETHDSLFSGSVPLETISQVTPRELVQADADGLPRNYYVLMIETTRRVLQIATERKEKADVWFEALNNVVAFVRRREMNKGALIPD